MSPSVLSSQGIAEIFKSKFSKAHLAKVPSVSFSASWNFTGQQPSGEKGEGAAARPKQEVTATL